MSHINVKHNRNKENNYIDKIYLTNDKSMYISPNTWTIVYVDENGNEKYIRPNFILVAFTEWLMVLLLPASQILYCLLIIALA